MSDPHHKPHVHETPPLHDPIDRWHDHSKDEKPQPAHAEVGNAFRIMAVGIGLFLVIVFAALVTYGFYVQQSSERLDTVEIVRMSDSIAPAMQARKARSDSQMSLEKYGWIEVPAVGDTPARSIVQIPINAAKQKVAQEYGR